MKTPITVAHGDGIGPEIMASVLSILEASNAQITIHPITVGKAVYEAGFETGIQPQDWDTIERTKILLKAPITTPQGGGYKSLNVTLRKALGLYANIRPCVSYAPIVQTKFPSVDVVIVRENEEDLYAGIEYRHTEDSYESVKLISRPGCERIVRYAFEDAVRNGRKKVTCLSKDNIMKMTDGLFHKVFDEVAKEYPNISTEHYIIDIGTARLATVPERFDVVVTLNLYGDIVSDVVAELTGSVGLAASANIGAECAMFEAIHGSAPDIAGKGIANPSGLLLSAIMMLVHINQRSVAERIHNAWLATIESGFHTADIYREGHSIKKASTSEFTQAVIQNLGQLPKTFPPVTYTSIVEETPTRSTKKPTPANKLAVGVDIFIDSTTVGLEELASQIQRLDRVNSLKLQHISNRGIKIWPGNSRQTLYSDLYQCRFKSETGSCSHIEIAELLSAIAQSRMD